MSTETDKNLKNIYISRGINRQIHMVKLFAFVVLVYSSLTCASFSLPTVNWNQLSPKEQAALWVELRSTLKELDSSAHDEVAHSQYNLIQEAYAAGFECFVAGWPSTKTNGKCQSPVKANSSYAHHLGCGENQLLCNPTVFGESLCIEFKTSAQKNGAFASCEKKFAEEGRLYSQVLDQVDPDEMNELLATVHSKCQINSQNYSCIKLRKQYDFLIPNETPVSYKAAQSSLTGSDPKKIVSETKKVQREMEEDIAGFKKTCEDGIEEHEKILCKNLALRIKKAHALVPKLHNRINQLTAPDDCINCSSESKHQVLNKDAIPSLEAAKQLQCTDADRKRISNQCFGEVQCVIISTAMTVPNAIMETFGKKPGVCSSSQDSCVTNLISALIDSLVTMVTGLWDLLKLGVDWASEKISDFWKYMTEVEDKTADVQHLINKMSDQDVQDVKTDPIKWVTNLASNIWQGIKEWMKEDIFCEKWAGIPRASACVEPSKGFDCMSCRTMITGTCSAAGVIIAEVLPAFFTGGTVNLAAKAGSGAKVVSKFIKVSKAYKKVISAVDKLADVKALKILATTSKATVKVVKQAVKPASKVTRLTADALSSSYKTMISTKAYKAMSKSMDVAAKYSGISAYNKLNARLYNKGYAFVDSLMGVKATVQASEKILAHAAKANSLAQEVNADLKPLYDDITEAYEKQVLLKKLEAELTELSKLENVKPENTEKIAELVKNIQAAKADGLVANNRFIEKLMAKYEEKGIPALMVDNTDGSKMLKLDFASAPTKNSAFEFYRRVHKNFGLNNVTMSLQDNLSIGSLGFFQSQARRIDMGPGQGFSLLEEYFNSVSKHESRHAMFFAKRNRGKDSIFHAQFRASPDGKLLNADQFYDTFMSAEELYTFSTDLQSLAQVLKGEMLSDLVKKQGLLEDIAEKSINLKSVATSSRNITQSMVESLDEIMLSSNKASQMGLKMNPDGSWDVLIRDKLGRSTNITLIGAEEKALAKSIQDGYKVMMDRVDKALEGKLAETGVDVKSFTAKFESKTLSTEEMAMLEKLQTDYFASPAGKGVLKELDDSCVPILENAKKMMSELNQVSVVQIKESEHLTDLIKTYADKEKGGSALQLQAIKDQMFKTAKNVKEDYKGYVLKSP